MPSDKDKTLALKIARKFNTDSEPQELANGFANLIAKHRIEALADTMRVVEMAEKALGSVKYHMQEAIYSKDASRFYPIVERMEAISSNALAAIAKLKEGSK